MSLLEWREGFILEGIMPERALLRLKRAGIPLYNVKKAQKNRILFQVKRKDSEKVFAIYPNVCYNNRVYSAYAVRRTAEFGIAKYITIAKRRVGMLLGGLLCMLLVLLSQPFVFEIEFTGTDIYAREAKMALEEAGIALFRPYAAGKEDLVCARLLALDNVEFCSVRKRGHRIVVETRLSPFPKYEKRQGVMSAGHSGTITAMTVLRGSPLKRLGDEVRRGDALVADYVEGIDGGQVRVEIIARVRIACTWAGVVEADSPEEAFAIGYLALGLGERDTLLKTEIMEKNGLYHVTIGYEAIEAWNL